LYGLYFSRRFTSSNEHQANYLSFIGWFAVLTYRFSEKASSMLSVSGLVQILLFQGLGELASHFLVPSLPGPVIGLLLLLCFLLIKGKVNPSLEFVALGFSQNLGLLFVPAAVGVVLFLPQLKNHWLAITVALFVSVAAAIAVTALVLRMISGKDS
jgi:holin-like protein